MIYIFEPHTDLTHAVVYGEIGNIPLNIEYCMIKHRSSFSSFKLNELTIINIFKRMNEINVITYIIVRIFFYTYFMLFLDFSCYSTYYAFIPLYMMGIGWSNQLIKQWQRHHIELDNIRINYNNTIPLITFSGSLIELLSISLFELLSISLILFSSSVFFVMICSCLLKTVNKNASRDSTRLSRDAIFFFFTFYFSFVFAI